MNFNDPQYFWWMIPVAALVVILACRAGKRKKEQLKLLLGSASDDPDAVILSKGFRRFRIFLLLVVLLFLAAAAARPYWTSRMVPYAQAGRDIMVLFDVSKSMLATDIAPSRLAHAKYILRELVKGDPQDRFGLVAFAGTAYTVCPLTSDPVAFEQYIDELSPDLVPVGGLRFALRHGGNAALRLIRRLRRGRLCGFGLILRCAAACRQADKQ